MPEGWARTDLPTGATFTDKLNSVRVEIGVPADPAGSTRIDLKPVDPASSYGRAYGFERMMDSLGAIFGPLPAIGLSLSAGRPPRWSSLA
ncbi:hypothetical protein [Herbidospora sp. RD11066]